MYIDWKAAKIFCIAAPIVVGISAVIGGVAVGVMWLIAKLFSLIPIDIAPSVILWFWLIVFAFWTLCAFDVIRFGKKSK